jgi:hypothetical protein
MSEPFEQRGGGARIEVARTLGAEDPGEWSVRERLFQRSGNAVRIGNRGQGGEPLSIQDGAARQEDFIGPDLGAPVSSQQEGTGVFQIDEEGDEPTHFLPTTPGRARGTQREDVCGGDLLIAVLVAWGFWC